MSASSWCRRNAILILLSVSRLAVLARTSTSSAKLETSQNPAVASEGFNYSLTADRRHRIIFRAASRPHFQTDPSVVKKARSLIESTPLSKLIGRDGTPGKVFSRGPYRVLERGIPTKRLFGSSKFAPPKPLRLWVPVSSSPLSAPVLLFQHGFAAKTGFYSQLLSRIASHGVIVVAPQMYPFIGRSNTRPEMRGSVHVITWIRKHLHSWLQQKKQRQALQETEQQTAFQAEQETRQLSTVFCSPSTSSPSSSSSSSASSSSSSTSPTAPSSSLSSPSPPRLSNQASSPTTATATTKAPRNLTTTETPPTAATYPFSNTSPDWSKFVLSGHSVGGKVALGVTRNMVTPASPVPIAALVLFDPSDGTSNTSKNVPPVLAHRPNSLVLTAPVLIIGSGLGPIPKSPGLPACPPAYFGHRSFFSDLAGPAYYFVVPKYGHLDFYDKNTGVYGAMSEVACKRGPAKRPMQVAASGIAVAFLKATIQGDSANLYDLLSNPVHSPVKLATPQSKGG